MLSKKRLNIFEEEKDGLFAFHGHFCGGLSIGMRAVALAKDLLNYTSKDDLMVITETDMCGVDAIQFLCSCTYGKGNLIHKDFGKNAFTFIDHAQKKAVRIILKANKMEQFEKAKAECKDKELLELIEADKKNIFFLIDDESLFSYEEIPYNPPKKAEVLSSFVCESCKEEMMESRARHYGGKILCIPCFSLVEQKI